MGKSTHEALPTWPERMCSGFDVLTSSPELADGSGHLSLPGGLQMSLFGLEAAPVSLSPLPEASGEQKTLATCGQFSAVSLASAALQQSLESRLRQSLAGRGSLEYALTWRRWAIGSLQPICALRASPRRIFDRDCFGLPTVEGGGWATPTCEDSQKSFSPARAKKKGIPQNLSEQVSGWVPSGWSTPTTWDHKDSPGMALTGVNPDGTTRERNDTLARNAVLRGWPTPTATDGVRGLPLVPGGNRAQNNLTQAAASAGKPTGWPTPTATDGRRGSMGPRPQDQQVPLSQLAVVIGESTSGLHAETGNRAALNPALSRSRHGPTRPLRGTTKRRVR